MESSIVMAQHMASKDVFSHDEFMSPEGIEFACIINKQGRIEHSIFKNEIDITEDKKEMFTMGVQLQNSMQSDFDDEFGSVHYTIIERENARFVSIPTPTGVLLVKLDKSADPFALVNKIAEIMNPSKIRALFIGSGL